MAVRTFRKWAIDNAPTWLRGTWGGKLTEMFGFLFDTIEETNFEAGAAGSLEAPTFPADAIGLIGSERNMERYNSETDDQYATRIHGAWVAWPQAGTRNGLLSQLAGAGFDAEIKEMRDWDWDGNAANWSRIWVVIHNTGWVRTTWGDGRKWGEGVWGVNAPRDVVHTLRRLIRKWKPAHVVAIVVVVLDEVTWALEQPDGSWDIPANRSRSALYHYER